MKRNRTEFALLGLLAMGPKTGYDIKQEVTEVLSHFWSESYGNIYPMLRRLDRDGLVERRGEASPAGPRRYVYTITEDGLAEFREWLARPAQGGPPRNELLLKIFFGRFAPPGALRTVVAEYRARTAQMRAVLEGVAAQVQEEEGHDPALPYWLLTIDLGRRSTSAVVEWCDEALARLDTLNAGDET